MPSQIKVVQLLRGDPPRQDQAGMTDAQLLGRFLEQRDEAAVAALLLRHGPMVWAVCRRLLSHHDAEDAFQAPAIRYRSPRWRFGLQSLAGAMEP